MAQSPGLAGSNPSFPASHCVALGQVLALSGLGLPLLQCKSSQGCGGAR